LNYSNVDTADVVLVFSRPFDLARSQTAPPLGVMYLAAVLEESGFKVCIVDLSISDMDSSEAATVIASMNSAVVGFSCTTPGFPLAMQVAEKVKQKNPRTKIVVGGPFATFAYDEILTTYPWVDVVVRREGEYTFLDLAYYFIRKGLHPLGNIPGIVYKGNGSLTLAPERPFIENLDILPFPALHLLKDIDQYDKKAGVITSRGCPFGCAFCSSTVMWGNRTRFRSVENVMSEIRMLVKDFAVKEFRFVDDTFTLDRERALHLCSELEKLRPHVTWRCITRADMVDEEVLRAMKRAGCVSVQYGIESAHPQILALIGKKIFREEVEKKVDAAKKVGLKVNGSFVIGLPGETREMIEETIEFAESLSLADTQVNIAMPFLGTPLRSILVPKFGARIRHNDWENYHQNFKESGIVIENPQLPLHDLLELCFRARMINLKTFGVLDDASQKLEMRAQEVVQDTQSRNEGFV
jgi:anaerobic magnesium-protoporphyrin IX monomethyl ester cyclase